MVFPIVFKPGLGVDLGQVLGHGLRELIRVNPSQLNLIILLKK
jgi:hypothetical protein